MSHSRYKTKLCNLYLRGNCHRASCSFAHGDEELRPVNYDDREQRFDRRYSFGRHYRHYRRSSRDRDVSRSRSPARSSMSSPRSADKRSGSHLEKVEKKIRSENGGSGKEGTTLTEQLHMAAADLEAMSEQQAKLEVALQSAASDLQKASSTNNDLETELSSVQADNRRLLSKLRKVQRAYKRRLRLEEDSRRASAKFDKVLEEELKESDTNAVTSEGEPEQQAADATNNGDLQQTPGVVEGPSAANASILNHQTDDYAKL